MEIKQTEQGQEALKNSVLNVIKKKPKALDGPNNGQ